MTKLRTVLPLAGLLALCGCSGDAGNGSSSGAAVPDKVGHVFIIVLENEGFAASFGSGNGYLATTLPAKGQLLTRYFATSHHSLSNYVTMISGQGPTVATQTDCPSYTDFSPPTAALDENGQVTGSGCVYPAAVKTIANQLQDAGLSWKAYMEDMGNDSMRDNGTNCAHPMLNAPDQTYNISTQTASSTDQYATRHNPFVYFHAIVGDALTANADQLNCEAHDVPLTQLDADLQSAATTPNFAFIVPNVCNDGHDPDPTTDPTSSACANGSTVIHVDAINQWLPTWVDKITKSEAFKRDGLLIVTFDEAESGDTSACCGEDAIMFSNTPSAGGEHNGPGGGLVGAVLISPLIKAGTTNDTDYNHYALLRSIEDIFGLSHLGYANQANLKAFGPDVYNNANP